jgi:parvulin-like peptidyl-prolyl isomerase
MTQAEKFAMVRAEAMKQFVDFKDAEVFQVGVATFVVKVADGFAKVTVQAVKDADFDAAQAEQDFKFEQDEKQVAKDAKAMEKAMKAAARDAAKAKNA